MPPGGVIMSRTRRVDPVQGSEGPDPGWFEQVGAAFRVQRDDREVVQVDRLANRYLELQRTLIDMGVPRESLWREKAMPAAVMAYSMGGAPATGSFLDRDAVWAAIQQQRTRNPKAFAGLPKTREEFDLAVLNREGATQRDERTIQRGGSITAQLAGGFAASALDPENILTAPIGGGAKNVAQAFVQGAIINGLTELAMTPGLARARERRGSELTAEEAAINIGGAALFGGVISGGGKFVGDNWGAIKSAPRDVQERVWGAILDRTPGLRDKIGAKLDWSALDPHLADIAEATIDRTRMTDAERGAIAALRREAAADAGNPFVPDGAGTESHYRLLGETLQGIIDETPAYVPKSLPSPAARLRSGTSVGSGVTGDAMQTVKARIGVVESGGSATARNPRSSAMGLYQFTDGTWLSYYKARFGSQGLSDAQIIARKGDTGLQNTLMDDLLADNARALQDAGHRVDAGNLYLAHFAGRKGATDLLAADPATPAVRVLGERVIAANPFLRGKTAGDVIAWAHGKMGGKAPALPARGEDGTADVLGAIDRELADTEAELARLDSELAAGTRTVGAALDDIAPEAVPMAEAAPLPRPEADGTARPPIPAPDSAQVAGMTPEARAIMPQLKGIIDRDRDISLNDPAALSARLGVDERNLQLALQQMAIDGLVIQKRNGSFTRLPRPKDGPMDVLTYVASRGGVTPKGFSQALIAKLPTMENPPKGHDLATIFQVERKVRWKKKPTANDPKGVPLAEPYWTTRPALIPGYGPIVRSTGRGLDEIGEDLWEAGYFGPMDSVPRPTERDVIDLLQRAFESGEKVYSINDAGRIADMAEDAARAATYADPKNPFASDFQSEEHFDFEFRQFDAAADEAFGIALDEEGFIAAWGEYRQAGDGDVRGAVLRSIQREIEDVQAREIAERGFDDAEDIIAEWEEALRRDGFAGGEEGGRPLFEPGDPGPDAPDGWAPFREDEGPLDPERWRGWDEPDGPAAQATADSMEHDLRVQVERQVEIARQLDSAAPYRAGDWQLQVIAPGVTRRVSSEQGVRRALGEVAAQQGEKAFNDALDFLERARTKHTQMGNKSKKPNEDWINTDLAWSKIGDIEIRRGPPQALDLAKDMPFEEAKAFVQARDPAHPSYKGLTPSDPAFYPSPRAPEPALSLDTLTPGSSVDDIFVAMRDLPDTQESMDAIAAARSRLWEEAEARDMLDEAIARFDDARDRWDAQFEAARDAEGQARMEALRAEQSALATAIADHVNSGRGVMRLLNSARNTLPEYGPGTVRVRNGQLEVVEGRNWVGVPSSSLAEIASRMGVKLDEPAPAITTDASGQADFAAPTGAQVRTALERQTEGGLRPTGPQRAPGEDGGLFDTRDTTGDMLDPPAAPADTGDLFEGVAFRLDEEGDVVNPADLLAEFDEDAAFLKNIRDCL